jgi:hypothetical protein
VFDRWCWPFCDPESRVPTSGAAVHDYGPAVGRALELEFSGRDFATMADMARGPNSVGSLSAATGGDLARSPRWDQVLRSVGIGDEAILACRDTVGCWGWIKAYRDTDDPSFTEQDLELLGRVGPPLGSALRRRLGEGDRDIPPPPRSPGVVVLNNDLRAVSWTAGAREWIDALPLAGLFAAWGILPAVVYPVAALARSQNDSTGAHGLDTRAVSARLCISPHTVQDHLKSIFRKTGAQSRRELLARFSGASEAASATPPSGIR